MTREGKVLFYGDPHGEFGPLIAAVRRYRPHSVVIAGDIQANRPLDRELIGILSFTDVWWIPGNHDTDSDADYDHLFGSQLADRNLHGRVADVAGLRIAGLGGIFRSQVWMPPAAPRYENELSYLAHCGKGNFWRGGLPRRHRSTIFPDAYQALLSQSADVLVTHEAPSCHPHGFAELDTLIQSIGASRVFHGHHHQTLSYRSWGACQIFGLGECAVMDLSGEVVA